MDYPCNANSLDMPDSNANGMFSQNDQHEG